MSESFPSSFVWGAATSAYQVEGAARNDGRGPSIWDDFCTLPGAVYERHSGEVACDHYHRCRDDIAIMREIGLRAYRFSIAWPRILPAGTGEVNQLGLDFYSELVDELLRAGITPFATLYHWDLPSAVQHRGGWLHRDIASWFADYASVVVERLGDRVTHWMTLNEPQVFLKFGLGDGVNAPGLKLPLREQLLAAHHAMLAHGRGVKAIRAASKGPCKIGWAPVCVVKIPASEAESDVLAARDLTNGSAQRDLWNNTWFNDPVLKGEYPRGLVEFYADDTPKHDPRDLDEIRQPLDFLGLNIYEGQTVRAGPDGRAVPVTRTAGHARTAFGWPIEPESLYWGPRFMQERYGLPIYITENGLSNLDWVGLDGRVRDPQRIDFTTRYLRALRRAMRDGADIRGYFHWSFMDNFEWAAGYRERFGLVHVDYATQRRTIKDSARWYRRVIETNGAILEETGGTT